MTEHASRRRLAALAALGLLSVAITAVGFALLGRGARPLVFVGVIFVQGAVYLAAYGVARRLDGGRAVLAIIVLTAVLARAVVLFHPPYLSSDVYRFVWDGRVQAAGINPYRYVPADENLRHLRDERIFPYINRSDYATTAYPPAAEVIYFLVTRLGETTAVMRAAMAAFDGITCLALYLLLGLRGLPRTRLLLFAWHPMPIWEFAGNGHVDAAAIALTALAFLAAERRASGTAGALLAAATLVKFFPAAVLPAVYRRWDRRLPAAFAATAVLFYLPYIGVGPAVLGFLPGYVVEQGLGDGRGSFLWTLSQTYLGLPHDAARFFLPAAAAGLLALGLAVLLRRRGEGVDYGAAALLMVAFTVVLSPHYPWYFSWLITFLCFRPSAGLVYLTFAGFFLYVRLWPSGFALHLAIYAPALVLFALEAWPRARARKPEGVYGDEPVREHLSPAPVIAAPRPRKPGGKP